MRFLLDTHVLLWAAGRPERLSRSTRKLLDDPDNGLHFSVASLCEILIKQGIGRDGFAVDVSRLRRNLLDNGYDELAIAGARALAADELPPLHEDPFDRILIAQARVERLTLLTADATVLRYPGAVQKA